MKVHKLRWHNLHVSKALTKSEAIAAALSLCKGRYQRALIRGEQAWSGADLRGNAAHYADRYAISRNNLLYRVYCKDIPFAKYTTDHNRIVVSFGKRNVNRIHSAAIFNVYLRDKKHNMHYTAKAIDNLICAMKDMHEGNFAGYKAYNVNLKKAQIINMMNIIEL